MDPSISSRRRFIVNSALATLGLTALSNVSVLANSLDGSLKTQLDFFKFPKTNDLRKPGLQVKSVEVIGTLYDKSELTPLPNTDIRVWHISPDSEEVGHMGQFTTDENGNYRFTTDFPGHEFGLKARIHFSVAAKGVNHLDYLILDNQQVHYDHVQWRDVNSLGDIARPQLVKFDSNGLAITKNILI